MKNLPEPDSSGLAPKLWRLANFIRNKVTDAKAQDKLVKTSEVYVQTKITDFAHQEGGLATYITHHEYVEKPEWHWSHKHDFIQREVKDSPAYRECTDALSKVYGDKSGRMDHGLPEFAQVIASAVIVELSDEQIIEFVTKFIGDLNNSPTEIQIHARVEGFWLKQDVMTLQDFTLQRITQQDLEDERPLHLAVNPRFEVAPFSPPPPVTLDLRMRGTSGVEAQEELERIIRALRLFRLGSVRYASYVLAPNSILRPKSIIGTQQRLPGRYKYLLAPEDKELLSLFVSRIKPLLKTGFGNNEPGQQPADLALLRYSDAVLGGNSLEAQITGAITCLEALFLKAKERSELSHKLSLRVASLLRSFGLNPLEVQGQIHQAYEIRSTHIHGGLVERELIKDGSELCKKVLEYARLSIVTFLQLKDKVDKDEFINKLDRALLEPKSLERIEKQLNELVIPK